MILRMCGGKQNGLLGRDVTDYISSETELLMALTAIPEIAASGFRVARDGHGIIVSRRRSPRGHWRAVDDGFAWIPVNAQEIARVVPTLECAVRETLLVILISLQVKRRPPAEAMKTAEAILPNPATRVG